MQPLWKIRSGAFAGWREADYLYDACGHCAGYFSRELAFDLSGRPLGEMIGADGIGKLSAKLYSAAGPKVPTADLAVDRQGNRPGVPLAGWEDPEF